MLYPVVNIESRSEFLFAVNQQEFKDLDNAEAIELGYISVKQLYNSCFYPYSKYCLIYDNSSNVICTIELKRDGQLIYFVTKALTANKIPPLIRTVKDLADQTVARVDIIFTTTLNTYEGAIAFNKMVGFTLKRDSGKFSTWAYEVKK